MPITTTGRATDFITFTRTSNATVTDSNGFIEWAGHNLLTNSESFDASAWTKLGLRAFGSGSVANAVVAPNGTQTADLLVEDTSSSYHETYPSGTITLIADAQYTFAVYCRGYLTGRYLNISGSFGASSKAFSVRFDPATTTLSAVYIEGSAVTNATASYAAAGNDFYRVSITFTATTGNTAASLQFALSDTMNAPSASNFGLHAYTGDNTSGIYLWGAHLYRSDLGGMVLNPARGDAYYPTTPRNLLGFTEAFDNAAWGKTNLAVTPVAANDTLAPNGLLTADKFTEDTASNVHSLWQSITITANTNYTFSVYLKYVDCQYVTLSLNRLALSTVYASAIFDLQGGTVSGTNTNGGTTLVSSAITAVGNGWYRCSIVGNIGANTDLQVYIATANAATGASFRGAQVFTGTSRSVHVWGAQLSDSASLDAYSPVYGAAVTSAAYYAPRLDYDANGSALGLLVEEQRTNLLLQSSDYDSWSKSNATVSVDVTATTAPDGTTTSDKIVATAVSGLHYVSRSASVTSSAVYTLTVYAKAAEETDLSLGITDSPFPRVKFNLSNGTKTSEQGGATGTIASVGNGWYRCSCTFTAPSSSVNPAIIIRDLDTNWTGNGTGGLYAYGAQLELGSFPTSFIPTGASTATRTADVASVSTQAFPYSASEGTLVASGLAFNFAAGSSTNCLAALSDGTTSNANYVYSFGDTPYSATTNGGNVQANITSGSALSPNTVFKLGYAIKANDFAFTSNGASVGTDTSGSVPTANQLQLGRVGSAVILNGHIRQITYIPRRLTNAELVARST